MSDEVRKVFAGVSPLKDLKTARELDYFFYLDNWNKTPKEVNEMNYNRVRLFRDLKNIQLQGQQNQMNEIKNQKFRRK